MLGFRIALQSLVTDLFLAFRLASSLMLLFDVVTLKQSGRGLINMLWLGRLNASKIIASRVRGVSVTVAEGASTIEEGASGPIVEGAIAEDDVVVAEAPIDRYLFLHS